MILTNPIINWDVNQIDRVLTYTEVLVNLKKSWLQNVSTSLLKQIRDKIVVSCWLSDHSESEFEKHIKSKLAENSGKVDNLSKIYENLNILIEQ